MVTDVLRDLITDRQLSPGTPLRQRDLAEQFDMSYTPAREALRRGPAATPGIGSAAPTRLSRHET
jgi:DNA-binding FadR family transcriptional regulator